MNINSVLSNLSHYSLNHKWRVVIICTLVSFLTATGAARLVPASDYRVFFSADNPQRLAYEELGREFTKNDNILLVIEPADGQVFKADFLNLIHQTTERLWQLPYVIRVDSISNFQHSHANGDTLIVEDLYQPNQKADLAELEQIALDEPQLINRLISAQANITGINISVLLPGKNPMTETPAIVNAVRQLGSELEQQYPGLKTYLTGVIMLNNAFAEASLVDMTSLIPAVFGLVLLTLMILLRSLKAVFISLLVMLYAIMMSMGFAGWMGFPMTPPMAIIPIIVMTLAVANSVHIMLPALKYMRSGMQRQKALVTSLKLNRYPVFLTSLTTALGFLALNTTEVLPFHHMGNTAAFGVTIALLFSLLLLPALFMLIPIKVRVKPDAQHKSLQGFAQFITRYYKILLILSLVSAITITSFTAKNVINENLIQYFDPSIAFRHDSDHIARHLTGTGFIDYALKADKAGVSEPEFLHQVDSFIQWLKTQPEVLNIYSITDTLKRLNKNLHEDQIDWYRLPEQKNQAAQYLLLYEMSLPYGLDLNNQVNLDKTATRVSVAVKNMSAMEYIDLDHRARHWMQQHTPDIASIGSSPTMMFAHISMNNASSILLSTTLALIGISGILLVTFRSLKLGLISLVPNLIPIGMGFGLWGLFNGEIGLGLSLVAATSLGIIVDDTVHFLSKYCQGKRDQALNTEAAIAYAFDQVGPALLTTSVALIAGFSVLYFSVFKLNSDMGILTATTLLLALVLDFILLPSLLLWLDRSAAGKVDVKI